MNRLSPIVIVASVLALTADVGGEQRQSSRGLFIGTRAERVELTAYAEPRPGRRLGMAKGTLEGVPTIRPSDSLRVFCAMPNWQPSAIVLGTAAVFREDNAETRTLPFAVRMVNVFAAELRVADLEQPGRVAQLIESVGASGDNQAYLFVVMFSSGMMRYFPVRLTTDD